MKYITIFTIPFILVGCKNNNRIVSEKPNIIVINVDELRWDALGVTGHSFVKTPNIDRLATEGILMKNSFVTTPLSGPSRCSTMSGQYAHTHGLYKNTVPRGLTQRLITYPLLLQYAGYRTAFIGKWTTGETADKTPHPGFDRWFCTGVNRDSKINPTVNVDGVPTKFEGHSTDIESNEAIRFIKENKDKPFSICLWHRSVHTSYGTENLLAAERNRNLYKDVKIKRAISADTSLLESGRYGIVKQPALKNINMTPPTDEDIRNISRMLVDIDDGIGLILKTLEEEKILDKTMIIFTGDNGFFFGEHGLTEKRLAYEESIRVPFIVRYTPIIKPGSTSEVSVLNIDIAPTILSLAGLPIPIHMEGQSLIPVLGGGEQQEPRSSLLFEFFGPEKQGSTGIQAWKAVRTDKWKYIHWTTLKDADELYNLEEDPYEMNNLFLDNKHGIILKDMEKELSKLLKVYNDPGELLQILMPPKVNI